MDEIDENLYSRQLYAIGIEAQKKFVTSSVLISELGGLGVEIAKNIILAGMKKVHLQDTRTVSLSDLSSQFYLTPQDIGKNFALASRAKLAALNDYVEVSATNSELNEDILKSFSLVVITDYRSFNEITTISTIYRTNSIKLIITDVCGVFRYTFVDFGNKFYIQDPRNEIHSRFLLSFIAPSGIVTINEEELHNLSDGDSIHF
jgi:ubiquitin-activating enzyme E1